MDLFNLLLVWFSSAAFLYVTAVIVPGFVITSFSRALLAAILVGLFNMFLRPILWFLTLPINILTLGLFTFVLNAIILRIAAGLMKGFDIKGWGPGILGAIVLSILQVLVYFLFG